MADSSKTTSSPYEVQLGNGWHLMKCFVWRWRWFGLGIGKETELSDQLLGFWFARQDDFWQFDIGLWWRYWRILHYHRKPPGYTSRWVRHSWPTGRESAVTES